MVKIEAIVCVCVCVCVYVCVCVCVCWLCRWPVSLALVIGSSLPPSLFSSLCSSRSCGVAVDKQVGLFPWCSGGVGGVVVTFKF